MKVCLYEDDSFPQFYPLTYLRPVYLLRPGILPLNRRISRQFPRAEMSLSCRAELAPLLAERIRDYPVNILKASGDDVLFLNGRIRDFGDLQRVLSSSRLSVLLKNGDDVIGVLFRNDLTAKVPQVASVDQFLDLFEKERDEIADFDTTATLYHYLWEMVGDIDKAITDDFEYIREMPMNGSPVVHEGAWLINGDRIRLDDSVEVSPGALIDASSGPVYVGMRTRIEPQAAIYGPCFIGPNSVVVAGKISGCSIGHTCRAGGEIEESIFQSYVNKYHAGFIGHSYVGSWVNFGAMTTNSDLKNNYSNIRVTLNGESVDSGSIKVGSFVGDHTKTGIGTLLNTGINIGVSCNIFGGSLVADKEVPSFSWGTTGQWTSYRVDKALETARRSTARREYSLSEAEEKILQSLSEGRIDPAGSIRF